MCIVIRTTVLCTRVSHDTMSYCPHTASHIFPFKQCYSVEGALRLNSPSNMSSSPSPMKLRRKATTPLRERVAGVDFDEINDFRENNGDRFLATRRRRLKKSRYICMMLWGATVFFGAVRKGNGISLIVFKYGFLTLFLSLTSTLWVVVTSMQTTITILASREAARDSDSILPKVLRLRTRRRLGITVVQPIPIHNRQGPIKTIVMPDSIRDELYQEVANLKVDTSNLRDLESFVDKAKETIQFHIGDDFLKALRSLHSSSAPTFSRIFQWIPLFLQIRRTGLQYPSECVPMPRRPCWWDWEN